VSVDRCVGHEWGARKGGEGGADASMAACLRTFARASFDRAAKCRREVYAVLRLQSVGMGVEHECRCLGTCLELLFNALYLPLQVRYLAPIERGGPFSRM
jgi:hypothetical protein